jgi:hypothetical protein
MIYLLIFYWIFASLFCYGSVYGMAKIEKRNIFGVFLACLVIGGFLFPMLLGRSLIEKDYE